MKKLLTILATTSAFASNTILIDENALIEIKCKNTSNIQDCTTETLATIELSQTMKIIKENRPVLSKTALITISSNMLGDYAQTQLKTSSKSEK